MNNTIQNQEEENINIKKYLTLFLDNWRWFIFTGIIAVSIAFLINRYSTSVYESQNTVYLTEKEDAMGAMSTIMKEFGSFGSKTQNIENQIGILTSYSLTRKTLERLNYQVSYFDKGRINDVEIFEDCPFRVILDSIKTEKYKEKIFITIVSENEVKLEIPRDSNAVSVQLFFGETFENADYIFKIVKSDIFDTEEHVSQDFFFQIHDYNELTKKYLKNLTVEASFKKGTILQLTSKGSVPEKVVEYLNTLIIEAIENDLREKNATSIKTIEFIDDQLTSVVDSLTYAEKNLETFRSSNKIVNLSEEGSSMFKKLEELQAKKSLIEIKIKYYEYLLKTIRDKNNFKDIITPSVIGVQDQLLNTLVAQLSQLYSERQVLEYSATGDNPSLQIINMKIKNTIAALIDNVNNLIESAHIESKETQKEIAKVDAEIKKLPSTERELINIQRKFELNDNIYNYLLQKRAEVGITKAANLPDLKFIDYALLDNTLQTSPNRKLNYLIALFLGLFIPGLMLIVRDFMNDTIVEREEIERKTSIPIIGSIAHNRRTLDVIPVKLHPKSSIAETFRAIRTNLAFFIKNKQSQTPIITFTSTISGEGKTFCALNLAAIISMNNKKVVVVGLDLRKPKLQQMLQTNFTAGITNYLIGTHTLQDITITTDVPNLNVILSGPIPPNPLELIESDKFSEFITELKQAGYDYIIFDTPPIGLVADTLSISKYSDLNVFIMRQNYTNRNSIKFINDISVESKIKNLCILINDVNMINSYGYRYGAYRNNKYGYGYYEDEAFEDTRLIAKFKRILKKQK